MLISCNKLKSHIKNGDKIDWSNIWKTFTIRSAEVEGVEVKGEDLKDVVVAEIMEHEIHPKKDKYHLLKVYDGENLYSVLCGAPNCRKGMKVAFVKPGGMVSGFEIGEKTIAGVLSQGMCCAVDELGIGTDHEGILELSDDAPLGMDITEYIPAIKDIIVEIDNKSLTNRPDMWGHYGIAREIASITNSELLPLEVAEDIPTDLKDIKITIKNKDLCNRFTALKVENITEKKSPLDMQIFLHYAGMRSISLLVDISNYVMLELGQPNHAYDAKKVSEIEVVSAKDKDTFITLDGITRNLTEDNLMIKNENNYIGIAGVMGGLDSEIEDSTTSVMIEAASFDSANIRKTASALGLRTEASARFEKSLDPNMTEICVKRFASLIKSSNPNIKYASNLSDNYPNKLEEPKITLTKEKLNRYMGFEMKEEQVAKILESLGFKVNILKSQYNVTVPTFRATKDIEIAEDLIEEIARMYGYENLEILPLKLDLTFKELENVYDTEYNLKRFLTTKYDLNEVNTYLWYKTWFLKLLNIEKENVSLIGKNEDNILRDDLSLSLLEVAYQNLKNLDSFGIYEIGTTIVENENKRILSILLVDEESKVSNLYSKAKDIAYKLFKTFKNIDIEFTKSENSNYYDNLLTYAISNDDEYYGHIKVFNKKTSNTIAKKKSFVTIEIDFDKYYETSKELHLYEEISKYPKVDLDYTIIAPKVIKYNAIDQVINYFKSPIINSYKLIDVYNDSNETKYTIRYTVGSNDRTLTTEDLNDFKEKFINHIKDNNLNIVE